MNTKLERIFLRIKMLVLRIKMFSVGSYIKLYDLRPRRYRSALLTAITVNRLFGRKIQLLIWKQ